MEVAFAGMSGTRKAERGTRKRAAGPSFQRRQLSAGALEVTIELDGRGHLYAVHLPKRIPSGLSAGDLAGVIAELERHTLAIEPAPPFHRRVWAKLRAIPPGKTLTYGRIAAALCNPRASRAVGQACAANRLALVIPCHRVVGVAGPGGFAWGLAWKAKLLELEVFPARKV
jgi:O-6-methylguanine DNA methyltransferase